jgi:hypothetical protein
MARDREQDQDYENQYENIHGAGLLYRKVETSAVLLYTLLAVDKTLLGVTRATL